ncbi:MAG: DUF3159 domain-containing protein [Marmoricola sp.]
MTDTTTETVEAAVRAQLSKALGGRRGMLEAAVPTVCFTITWLVTHKIPVALTVSLVACLVLLAVRLVQRSTVQFVMNALFGVAIGFVAVRISAGSGGSADDQALAYFLPGILISLGYSIFLGGSCLARWPAFGFIVGSVAGDPTAWHANPQVVRLCSRLTWLFALPGMVGVLLQGPVWLAGHQGALATGTAVGILTVLRLGVGWPLRIGAWVVMLWMLARNHTPIDPSYDIDLEHVPEEGEPA